MAAHQLSRDEARRIIVRAGLLDADRPGDVVEVAEQLGEIKIDPTSVIAPCEHTTMWSRIGWSYEPGQLKKAVEQDRQVFEFYGSFHAISRLPALRARMRAQELRASTREWLTANDRFRRDLLARLRAEGPLPASAIPDTAQLAKAPNGWSGSNQVPIMLDLLGRMGVVGIVGRDGRHRLWDIAERAYRDEGPELALDAAEHLLEQRSLQAAGLARPHWYWAGVGADTGEAAKVDGSTVRFRVDPQALAALDAPDPGGRVAFLSPYDRLLFDRKRLVEVFDFTYVLEQFKPKAQRRFGYFAHPILFGDRFIGLLDAELDRTRQTLQVNAVHELGEWDADERDLVRAEIAELAQWLGTTVSGMD